MGKRSSRVVEIVTCAAAMAGVGGVEVSGTDAGGKDGA
jgi:hypothetical protein